MANYELELHIKSCGELMTQAYSAYEASGCFRDKISADGWRMKMENAIAERSQEHIACMENKLFGMAN